MVTPHLHMLSPSILGLEKLLKSPPHTSCSKLEGEQQLLLSCPTDCATDRVGQHSCWVTDTGVRKWSLLPFYYSCSSVSGEAARVVLGMASMSVCGPIPISVSQGRMAECCCSFCPGELLGGCIFFAITDTSNLCFKTSFLKLRRKNISLPSQHRYVLLVEAKGCSACLSALQHQQICLTGTFRHLFAPR